MEYVIEKITGSKYYYLKYIKFKLNEELIYYKELFSEFKEYEIKRIEEAIKNDEILTYKNNSLDFKKVIKINKRIPIIKYLLNKNYQKKKLKNTEKDIDKIIEYWENIEKKINEKNYEELKNDSIIADFFKDKNNTEILLKIFSQEIYDSFVKEINNYNKSKINNKTTSKKSLNSNSDSKSKTITINSSMQSDPSPCNLIIPNNDYEEISSSIKESLPKIPQKTYEMLTEMRDFKEKTEKQEKNKNINKGNKGRKEENNSYLKSIKKIKEINNGYFYALYTGNINDNLSIMNFNNNYIEHENIELKLDLKSLVFKNDNDNNSQIFEFLIFNLKNIQKIQIEIQKKIKKATEYDYSSDENLKKISPPTFTLSTNQKGSYFFGSKKGGLLIDSLMDNITASKSTYYNVQINGGAAIDDDNIVLMNNNFYNYQKNLYFIRLSSKNVQKEKNINYSINICENSLYSFKLQNNENNNSKILLCACKKYLRGQKNGIILINYDFSNNDIFYQKFYETKYFEVYCFCQIFIHEDNNSVFTKINKNDEINYFLVGGFHLNKCRGIIKLYRLFYSQDSKSTEIEYISDFSDKTNQKNNYKSPICCIIQLKENGKIIVGCLDGHIYIISPKIENIKSYNTVDLDDFS